MVDMQKKANPSKGVDSIMKKVLFIFGTRPEAIKMAPLIKELESRGKAFYVKVCVTGQHKEMLYQVLNFFSISPDYDLEVMTPGQTLFGVTASIFNKIEPILDDFKPDIVLVQGDTTSVLVGAVGAFYKKIKIGHVEAGLRSGDLHSPFPEEMNRVLVSRIADYNFAPTATAKKALIGEGVSKDSVFETGNTVIDALLLGIDIVRGHDQSEYEKVVGNVDLTKRIVLVTGHRRESFGDSFEHMCSAIRRIALENNDVEVVYPVHLNPNVQEPVNRLLAKVKNIHLLPPLDYPNLIWLMEKSYLVLTDSGGIQEEAPTLGKPVLVMREVTERQEGIDAGTAKLVGSSEAVIYSETQKLLDGQEAYGNMANAVNPYGDGTASKQIADILEKR